MSSNFLLCLLAFLIGFATAYLSDENCVRDYKEANTAEVFLMFLDAESELRGDSRCTRKLHKLRSNHHHGMKILDTTFTSSDCKENAQPRGPPTYRCLIRLDCTRLIIQDTYAKKHARHLACTAVNSTIVEFAGRSEVDLNVINFH